MFREEWESRRMPLTIGANIASITAQRQLVRSTEQLSKVNEQLASGQRINSAGDDAAGLAIAESLRTDRRVFLQGVKNLNDGISSLNISQAAMAELTAVVIRIKELANQSSNGVLGNRQRDALDTEGQALRDEFARIVDTTTFNGVKLLDGSVQQLQLQAGYSTVGFALPSLKDRLVGDGTFGAATSFATESRWSETVTVADLNGDGRLDLITAGMTDSDDGYATIRLGNGDGTFGAATSFATESRWSFDVTVADLNGDGRLDLITAGLTDSNDGVSA
jgi:flagellin-like hook-associated protein FlgL